LRASPASYTQKEILPQKAVSERQNSPQLTASSGIFWSRLLSVGAALKPLFHFLSLADRAIFGLVLSISERFFG
jgi:hypothetical protein